MYAKNAWKKYTEGNINDVMAFNEEYKKFITNGKTERLCVKQAIVAAEANGFKEINSFKSLKTGDKVYVTNKDKNFAAFVIGISTPNPPVIEGLTPEQVRVEIGQTMTFIVLAFSELIHVFNIRNNKESIFKIGIGGNKQLFWAIGASAMLMLVILAIPVLRAIFSIPVLPMDRIVETIALVIAPVVIVEIFKLLKINTSKDE